MRHKFIFILSCIFIIVPIVYGQNEYQRIENKAQRFFDNEEWASANAMYLLMLEEEPRQVSTYAKSAVSNIMIGDTVQALSMVTRSMKFEVPLDSLLAGIRAVSFSIGRGDLYEHYLLKIKTTYPWFSRVADNYLMQYYAFRQNGPELIEYAETMLEGLPGNRNFLRMLAYGQLISGNNSGALETWHRVMFLYPEDYDTILDLANFYDATGEKYDALKWMLRAETIHPTPYVSTRISELRKTQKGR